MRLTTPRKRNEKRRGPFDREIYRRRNVVERTINWLKGFCPIATRYQKKTKKLSDHAANRDNSALDIVCKHARRRGRHSLLARTRLVP